MNAMQREKFHRINIEKSLPDPFCMTMGDTYYLTGSESADRNCDSKDKMLFDMYLSKDLHEWKFIGKLLRHPSFPGSFPNANFWAPEIVCENGIFHLYYTADSDSDPFRRFVRVAVSDKITGPYEDSGRTLTKFPSIDGHVFKSSDDRRFLLYTGNEGHPFQGQLVYEKMLSPICTDGNPVKLFPEETVEWEEGPFVFSCGNTNHLFSSSGNWRDGSYHIRRAHSTASSPLDFKRMPDPFLNGSAPDFHGPGHNSVFRAPNGKCFICCHAWDEKHTGRYPWICEIKL